MALTEPKAKLVARAGLRLSNAERSVASLRVALSSPIQTPGQIKQMEALLAERITEMDQARREWETLKDRPDWQFAAPAEGRR